MSESVAHAGDNGGVTEIRKPRPKVCRAELPRKFAHLPRELEFSIRAHLPEQPGLEVQDPGIHGLHGGNLGLGVLDDKLTAPGSPATFVRTDWKRDRVAPGGNRTRPAPLDKFLGGRVQHFCSRNFGQVFAAGQPQGHSMPIPPGGPRAYPDSTPTAPTRTELQGRLRLVVSRSESKARILDALVGGITTNEAIAAHLRISPETVKHHFTQLFERTGIHDRVFVAVLWGESRTGDRTGGLRSGEG